LAAARRRQQRGGDAQRDGGGRAVAAHSAMGAQRDGGDSLAAENCLGILKSSRTVMYGILYKIIGNCIRRNSTTKGMIIEMMT
jgi:hypothetical protein